MSSYLRLCIVRASLWRHLGQFSGSCNRASGLSPCYTFPNNRGGPRISSEPIHHNKSAYLGYFLGLWLHCPGTAPMELRVPCSVYPESPRITPITNQHDLTTNLARRSKSAPSCLSVPNEPRLDKNLPRLRPDVADGAMNSADSSPDSATTLPRLTPESSECIFLPSAPSEPRLNADLPGSATNHPKRAPVFHDSATEEPRISLIRVDSGLGHDNFKLSGELPISQESSRLTTNLLPFTPNHPDSATTHPDSRFVAHSAPESGMCNWGYPSVTTASHCSWQYCH